MSDKEDRKESTRDSEAGIINGLAGLFMRDAKPKTADVEVEYSDEK